jgi:hypothetical protein
MPEKLSPTQKAVLNSLRAHCRHRGYSPGSWIFLPEDSKWPRIGTLRAMARKGVIEFSEDYIVCQRDRYLRLLPPYTVEKPDAIPVHHLVLQHDDYKAMQQVLRDIDMYYELVIQNRSNDPAFKPRDIQEIQSKRRDAERLREKFKA